ncbi:MAG: hypothetical protein JO166_16375 [Deltaproteobacteria bacterium]|nr:hypothetical protein [Deltaproteobacteria bacterium]
MSTAARLIQAGQHLRDGICCDGATYQAAHGMLSFDGLPLLSLKAKAEPAPAYRLESDACGSV